MSERKYLPTLSELIDRLSIAQLKEVFISAHKAEYAQEIADICHDIQLVLDEQEGHITADTVRAIVVLSQMNLHIWHLRLLRKPVCNGTMPNVHNTITHTLMHIWHCLSTQMALRHRFPIKR